MPQLDLSSVCIVNQVACETTAADDALAPPCEPSSAPPQLDYAPESFWLSEDAELDWLDRNAFIDRKDSGKSHSTNLNPSHPSAAGSNRFSSSLKSKPSIIGLPKATKPNYANRRHSKTATIRLFPKRTNSVGNKSEPSSPKVSCMGRVRSRKDRNRKGKNRKKVGEPGGGLVRNTSIKERKPGFWKNFRSMFRPKSHKTEDNEDEPDCNAAVSQKKHGFNMKAGGDGSREAGQVEPPGLGGVKRFASGRRSDGWAAELEAKSEPLNKGGPIWLRREGGPQHVDVEVDRDWQSVGPASV